MESTDARSALEGPAAKLTTLDLTDGEHAALVVILRRACDADPEVEGFDLLTDDGTLVLIKDQGTSSLTRDPVFEQVKLARGLGLDPAKVWTDMGLTALNAAGVVLELAIPSQ